MNKDSLNRYKALWERDLYDRPPVCVRLSHEGKGGNWTKVHKDFSEEIESCKQLKSIKDEYPDDDMTVLQVGLGPAFMPAVLGASISFEMGTSWNSPLLNTWDDLQKINKVSLDEENLWLNRLLQRIDQGQSMIPSPIIGAALLTGPGDIMAALRGIENLCCDIYEHPAQIQELGKSVADAWADVSNRQFDAIQPLDGGYCDNYGIWTEGRSRFFCNDFSNLLSPDVYRDNFAGFDAMLTDYLECPWMHVHSGSLHLIGEYLRLPKVRGIQIVNDNPWNPDAEKLIPVLQRIQKTHVLLLRKFSVQDLQEILVQLSPAGLHLDVECSSKDEGLFFLDYIGKKIW